jgi:hypothetical protein
LGAREGCGGHRWESGAWPGLARGPIQLPRASGTYWRSRAGRGRFSWSVRYGSFSTKVEAGNSKPQVWAKGLPKANLGSTPSFMRQQLTSEFHTDTALRRRVGEAWITLLRTSLRLPEKDDTTPVRPSHLELHRGNTRHAAGGR